MIETNNILSNPSGPEFQFLVGEGTHPFRCDYPPIRPGS